MGRVAHPWTSLPHLHYSGLSLSLPFLSLNKNPDFLSLIQRTCIALILLENKSTLPVPMLLKKT